MITRKASSDVATGFEPRVQLLPQSLVARRKTRALQRFLVLLVIASLAVAGLATSAAWVRAAASEAGLVTAQQVTGGLVAEQQQYAEVGKISSAVAQAEEAQRVATSTEYDWAKLVQLIAARIPDGTAIEGLAIEGRAPWEPELLPEGPLRASRLAVVSVTLNGPDVLDAISLARSLSSIPGYSDSTITTVTLQNGIVSTTVVLTLDADGLLGRFATDDGATTGTDDSDDAADGDQSSASASNEGEDR